MSEINKMRMRELPEEAQAALSRHFTSASEVTVIAAMNWGFEVVKHLAVFNGGGLAAAAAIAQAASSDHAARVIALNAAHLFVCGLMVAVVTMVSVYLLGFVFTRTLPKTVLLVILSKLPLSAMNLRKPIIVWIGCNWLLTAISIALFFVGSWKLVAIA